MAMRWSENDTQYLLDNCGIFSNKTIAMRLHRTPHAVRQKLATNGVSIFSNFYTATLLGKELGRNKTTVMQWYRKGWLRGKKADWGRGYLQTPMVFVEDDIVAFLKLKYYRFDWRKIPNPFFRNVVEVETRQK